jgi:hypothetical protein
MIDFKQVVEVKPGTPSSPSQDLLMDTFLEALLVPDRHRDHWFFVVVYLHQNNKGRNPGVKSFF